MENKKKPATKAQAIFGKEFGNAQILNERPKGMPFSDYKRKQKEQVKLIRSVLH